jgi:MbtH protein
MANPFEDENGVYHVLVNHEGQHSLWPSYLEVPKGWTIALKSDTRAACLEYINNNWIDMRPKSLVAAMESSSEQPTTSDAPQPDATSPENPKTLH